MIFKINYFKRKKTPKGMPSENHQSEQIGYRSGQTFYWTQSGSKLFAKAVSSLLPLAELNQLAIWLYFFPLLCSCDVHVIVKCSGSVVEYLTRDREAAGSTLPCGPGARHIYPSLVLVPPRKTRPCLTERLLMGCKETNQTKCICDFLFL